MELHLSTRVSGGDWVVEVRTPGPRAAPLPRGRRRVVELPGGAQRGVACALPAAAAGWPSRGSSLEGRSSGTSPATGIRSDTGIRPSDLGDRGLPDRLRARPRQRGDAQRRPPVQRRAGRAPRGGRRAVRPDHAPLRRLVARGGREPVPRALPGAAGDRPARERRPLVGRPHHRGRHDRGQGARDRGRRRRRCYRRSRRHEPRRHPRARRARRRRPDHRLARARVVAPAAARGRGRAPSCSAAHTTPRAPPAIASTSSATAT